MRTEEIEIYSDQTNAVVLRHPSRKFPGVLIQGDSLYQMCQSADDLCREIGRVSPGYDDANELRNALWSYLTHYKSVLVAHNVGLPFSEQ